MTYSHKIIFSITKNTVFGVLICAALSFATPARAYDDYYMPVDDYYTPVDDYYTPYYGGNDYYTPVTNDYYTPVYNDYYTPVQSGYYAPAYTYGGYGYDSYGYDSYGYYSPGYTYGSYSYGPGYTYDSGPAYVQPTYVQPAPVVNQTPVSVVVDNNNTNTNNNANTNNNVITINNPTPVTTIVRERERSRPEYRQPTYYQPPVYNYGSTPYVSLSAVPYTGLELGFYGTVIYWSVLVLWCLFVAYVVVVKRVHTKAARWFKTFLFGGTAVVAATEVAAPAKREVAQAPTQTLDKTDDFIMVQVLRRA